MNFTVSLDRVLGKYTNGKYITGGKFSFKKFNELSDAKKYVVEEFKEGYFNHATIYDRSEGKEIERFDNTDWVVMK